MKSRIKKILKVIRTTFLVIVAVILLPFFIVIVRAFFKPALNGFYRQKALGSFIDLSKGKVHYEFNDKGPDAPVALLLHGITVPMVVWDKTIPALNDAGISTLRFDYYGRGFSDRPKVAYKTELYRNQTLELLDSLGITKPVHIMGVSLGGAISVGITARHPDKIASATLVDPAVSWSHENSKEEKRAHLKKRFDKLIQALTKGRSEEREEKQHMAEFRPHIQEQFKYRGIEFSLLSMAIYGRLEEVLPSVRKVAQENSVPVSIIWGEEDKLLPISLGVKLSKEMPKADFHIIKGGGHTPHYEKPSVVNPLLVDFVKTHSANSTSTKLAEHEAE